MDLEFFIHKSNANRPGSTRHYAQPYDRIVGIKSPKKQQWTPEDDGWPQNNYTSQETVNISLRLPQKIGKHILQYFEDYFIAPPDINHPRRTCHHFAQRISDPSTPEYAGLRANDDPANSAAQRIVREGIPISTGVILPMGVVGVFGCVSEKSGQLVGFHSLVGMGSYPPIQVFGAEGNMGFSSILDSQKRTEQLDQLSNTQLYVGKEHVDTNGRLISSFDTLN